MSASSNSSRRQSNNNAVNHNDAGGNLVNATKGLCAAEAGVSSARRSDDSDDELQVPSKFRKTMLSSSISPKMSSSSCVPLSSSIASIKLTAPDPQKITTSENVPVASSGNDEQTSTHFNSGESIASLPMDMETALSILLLPQESASSDESHEYITHSKDEYITFRRANPSDAPTLASFIHKSQRKLKMQIHQQNKEQKYNKLVENALDSKNCVQKVNNTLDSESLDPLDDVAALEMRLLSGLGCNSFGEDDSRCGGDVSHTNPPSIFSILVERHYCRSIKLERCEKYETNEQLHGLVGAALFFVRWDATNSCRYLDVTYLHVDTKCGELSESETSSDIFSIHQEKNDIIWRRMMLRLSTLCLATDCQSLHFTSVGRTHATKSDGRKSKTSQNSDELS